ncbi:oxidant-induced cell-cycle arrest protein 5 [[Candida] railenensis]|uniref:Oxidant-induced cell-cycle arrest protein 5 n=1 Tax=[Candida] railenensis TaxID=45579 RepID=A0A9P0QTG1_9ASCO|nr:oxidant-induced cell-cycle arrest protein 5 [[Candida] railenensis]
MAELEQSSPHRLSNDELSLKPQKSNDQLPLNQLLHPAKSKPVFSYEPEIFNLCITYLKEKNHHGLALLARQKGVPPFLRFKVWPVLLKYHPFVLNPFLQPDNIEDEEKKKKKKHSASTEDTTEEHDKTDSASMASQSKAGSLATASGGDEEKSEPDSDSELRSNIQKDLKKYIQRLNFNNKEKPLSDTEQEIFQILESAILKFIKKWGEIIKYDKAMAWVALGLAEWFPPIPKTSWVLVGRNISSTDRCYKSVFEDFNEFIKNESDEIGLESTLNELIEDETISNMKFQDVFERLTLVLLHSPEKGAGTSHENGNKKINKSTLPINGGSIEERVSFFIYLLRKLLPELSTYFQEEQILNKFGSHDDEWLIWWLKWCGSKVWSRYDRGRIWDLMLGYKNNDNSHHSKKLSKLKLDSIQLAKLGPDNFWSAIDINEGANVNQAANVSSNSSNDTSVSSSYSNEQVIHKANSFKDLIAGLRDDDQQQQSSNIVSNANNIPSISRRSSSSSVSSNSSQEIPISRLDPHIELIFISLALLKSKEHTLVELDQHEIRQYLSKLPSKSYNPSDKYKQHIMKKEMEKEKKEKEKEKEEKEKEEKGKGKDVKDKEEKDKETESLLSAQIAQVELSSVSNNTWKRLSSASSTTTELSGNVQQQYNYKVNYIDNVICEAGELWRKWLWREMMEDDR